MLCLSSFFFDGHFVVCFGVSFFNKNEDNSEIDSDKDDLFADKNDEDFSLDEDSDGDSDCSKGDEASEDNDGGEDDDKGDEGGGKHVDVDPCPDVAELYKSLATKCNCIPQCCYKCSTNIQQIIVDRQSLLQHKLTDGSRLMALAQKISATRTVSNSYFGGTKRTIGSKLKHKTRNHLIVNNIEVCADYFRAYFGISNTMLRRAKTIAGGKKVCKKASPDERNMMNNIELGFKRSRRAYIAEWLVNYAFKSGAEQVPISEPLEIAERAFRTNIVSIDKLCHYRLNETRIADIYNVYQQDCEPSMKVGIPYFGLMTLHECFLFFREKNVEGVYLRQVTLYLSSLKIGELQCFCPCVHKT